MTRAALPIPVLLALAASLAAAQDDAPVTPAPRLAVFVGEQIDFAELPDPCEDPANRIELRGGAAGDESACVVMDTSYWARYRVVEPMLGTDGRIEFEFLLSDHFGVPDFARARTALLFVEVAPDGGASLVKYQGYPVFATADGDWAYCGDPYPPGTPADRRRVVPIEFAASLSFADLSTLGPYAAAQFDDDTYERVGDRLRCRRGVRLLDLFEFVAREKLGGSGVDFGLPASPPDDGAEMPPLDDPTPSPL